jgi:hypothetical protein
MNFGTWDVRSQQDRIAEISSKGISKVSDPVAVQEVRWNKAGSQPADGYTFFYGNTNANRHLGTGLFVHKGITSEIKRIVCYLREY